MKKNNITQLPNPLADQSTQWGQRANIYLQKLDVETFLELGNLHQNAHTLSGWLGRYLFFDGWSTFAPPLQSPSQK